MKHWYLIWTYHDLYMKEFYKENELNMYITSLLNKYKNDPDFKFKVIYGEDVNIVDGTVYC